MNAKPPLTIRPESRLRLPVQVLFVLLLGMYILLAPQTRNRDDKDWSHLWLGGRMIATGHAAQMYDPGLQIEVYRRADPTGRPPAVWRQRNEILGCFNYPPPAAVAYAALAWMPMATAAVVNAYLSLGLALLFAWLLARSLHVRLTWLPVAIAILAYPPFFINLSLGQNAVISMCVLIGAWCLCNSRRDLLAGLVLGLLVCKPNWLLAVGWIPLVHRRWRVLFGLSLGAASILAATLLVTGLQPFLDYGHLFRKVAHLNGLPGYALDLKYNALGLFRKWLGAGSTAANALGWTTCLAMVLATWRASRGAWQPGTAGFRRLMACSFTATLWVNPHLNHYDLLVSAPCVVALAQDWKVLGRAGRIVVVGIAALTYAAVPWDRSWTWGMVFPVPSFAILALWGWLAYQTAAHVDREAERPKEAVGFVTRSRPRRRAAPAGSTGTSKGVSRHVLQSGLRPTAGLWHFGVLMGCRLRLTTYRW
ncbi:MAG: DUF2029 domain-containing protein [Phycisphaerae bacterium]|nr:DUF2029 domain-containing protein [Phycisphaerae bacterium]